jgi:hypothetical protein
MVAAVWYVGGPNLDDRAELRHSLRSVAANAPEITEAWVVGDVPDWFTGVKVPLPPQPDKFRNARQSIERFVNLPGAPSEFWLFMDDLYVIEPVEHLPICRLGRVSAELDTWLGKGNRRAGNTFHIAVIQTSDWIGGDPWAYLAHTPIRLDTAKVRDWLATYPDNRRLEPYLLYCVAGIGDEGKDCGNSKVAAGDDLRAKVAQPMPYLSSNPDSWPSETGVFIRRLFAEPCKWEA